MKQSDFIHRLLMVAGEELEKALSVDDMEVGGMLSLTVGEYGIKFTKGQFEAFNLVCDYEDGQLVDCADSITIGFYSNIHSAVEAIVNHYKKA